MRIFPTLLVTLLLTPMCLAQEAAPGNQQSTDTPPREIGPNEITERAVGRAFPLLGEWRARYILRQLELSSEQREAAEGLIQTVLNQPVPPINLGEIRRLMAELQAAKDAGDKEREAQKVKEIRAQGQQRSNEPEFLDNLRLQLNDAQKKELDVVLGRLKRNPSGHMRPVDVLDFVMTFKLTDEQKKKYDEVKEEHRKKATTAGRMEEKRRAQMMRTLVRKLNAFLTEKQRADLDARIQRMRTDRIRGIEQMDREAAKANKKLTGRRG